MFNKRREFLKKTIWGGITSSYGYSFLKNKSSSLPAPDIDNWRSIRSQFLLSENRKFFNTASLGASPLSVINTYDEWNRKLETTSETGHGHTKECRDSVADYFNCKKEEIAITRNTTEGINIVANGLSLTSGDEVILSSHEHVGCAVPWMNLALRIGIKIKLVDLDLSGKDNYKLITNAFTSKTKVVCISHVTCTTGMVLPIKKIVTECRKKNIISCIDGAQAPGMLSIDLNDMDPDFYATSGHKWLFGPKGTGILFINTKAIDKLYPTFAGAYTTEDYHLNTLTYSYRSIAEREEYGTRNTPLYMALKEAFDFHLKLGSKEIEKYGRKLSDLLRNNLKSIPDIQILSPETTIFNSAILTFKSLKINYKDIQKELMSKYKCRVRGIYENDLNAIRVSCALYNSEEEINYLSEAIENIISK